MRHIGVLTAAALTVLPVAAHAAETITYTYDSLGRLVAARSSGTVNNNQTASYCYDKAGNRALLKADTTGTTASCAGGSSIASTSSPAEPESSTSVDD